MGLQVRTGVIFVAEKRLQRPFVGLLQFFVFLACLPRRIAPGTRSASQLNIAYRQVQVIR